MRKKHSPTLGLDTARERQHAKALAISMMVSARSGDRFDKAVAYGYFLAIRDLALDEGAEELAIEMARMMEEVKE